MEYNKTKEDENVSEKLMNDDFEKYTIIFDRKTKVCLKILTHSIFAF